MSEFKVPTHEIKTPNKHVVVLKDFVSGYDDEAIEAVFFEGKHQVEQEPDSDGKPKAPKMEFEGSLIQKREREIVKRVVLSVDGNEGDHDTILDLVYSLRKEDTAFIKNACANIVDPPEKGASKKKS